MCIVYKMAPLSFLIMKRLLTIPHIGLVNIVAQREVVKELLQGDANPRAVVEELQRLLDDAEYRASIAEGLETVRRNLGSGNGARNMAELVLSLLPAANPETSIDSSTGSE
jgi:lipid-A-disaccharide synthase